MTFIYRLTAPHQYHMFLILNHCPYVTLHLITSSLHTSLHVRYHIFCESKIRYLSFADSLIFCLTVFYKCMRRISCTFLSPSNLICLTWQPPILFTLQKAEWCHLFLHSHLVSYCEYMQQILFLFVWGAITVCALGIFLALCSRTTPGGDLGTIQSSGTQILFSHMQGQ